MASNSGRVLRVCVALAVAASAGACGGGGSDASIGPFWVDTQVASADLDGDGLPDLLALGGDTVWVLAQRAAAFGFDAPRRLR